MNNQTGTLAGKVAVITGAGRGIGRAIALAYAHAGAAVVCSARSRNEIDETVALVVASGGTASAWVADVGSHAAMLALFQHAVDAHGGVDIVVANAGVWGQPRKVADSDPANWAETIHTNLIGAFHTAHVAIPHLRARGAGKIIFMGSGARHATDPGMSAYSASKLALWKLTQVLAMELHEHHISVNELIPGPVKTAMTDFGRRTFAPSEWVKEPDDVVPMAMFLATQPDIGPTAQSYSLMRRAG